MTDLRTRNIVIADTGPAVIGRIEATPSVPIDRHCAVEAVA